MAARIAAPSVPGRSGTFSTLPCAPVSDGSPVPGQSGDWWSETKSARGSSRSSACVPLPWWTSKSTTATRDRPWTSSACIAAMATVP